MAGERAVLMATDPPYLVDYDGGNHPQSWRRDDEHGDPATQTKHWDSYVDQQSAAEFYSAYLRAALAEALSRASDHLPVLRHDAFRDRA